MLHPSYSELIKVVNSDVEEGEAPVVNSRYSIVTGNSKARAPDHRPAVDRSPWMFRCSTETAFQRSRRTWQKERSRSFREQRRG